jgi:hypothetical protein
MLTFFASALECDRLAVEQDLLGAFDTLTQNGAFSGDDDAPFFDPTLDLPSRTEP